MESKNSLKTVKFETQFDDFVDQKGLTSTNQEER